MKNILILGPSRSGKTTLAKKLNAELGYSVVCFDNIVYAFGQAFPQLGICHGSGAGGTAANLADFLIHYFRALTDRHGHRDGVKFAAEGGFFEFDKIIPAMNEYGMADDFLFVGLVFGEKTPEELFRDIKKHDVPSDWSYNCDDETLMKCAEIFIEDSRQMREKFLRHRFMIYDVSSDRGLIMDEIISDIKITQINGG